MFIVTAKLNKKRLAAIVVGAGLLLIALIIALTSLGSGGVPAANSGLPSPKKISSVEKQTEYLAAYGWKTDPAPAEIREVLIPETFDDVFSDYAKLQSDQGFNLGKYKGKRVKRYTYTVTNYPGVSDGTVRANLFIYKNTVIAGDVSSVKLDGFMSGLQP